MVLAMWGKLFIATSMTVIFLYTNELYPTVIRTEGFCLNSVMARIGSILAPYTIVVGTTVATVIHTFHDKVISECVAIGSHFQGFSYVVIRSTQHCCRFGNANSS